MEWALFHKGKNAWNKLCHSFWTSRQALPCRRVQWFNHRWVWHQKLVMKVRINAVSHKLGTVYTMTIIDVPGYFEHQVHFCTCKNALEPWAQLMMMRFFPCSMDQPKTAFTFACLNYYIIDSMECKTPAMSFMGKQARLSDALFPDNVPVKLLLFYFSYQSLSMRDLGVLRGSIVASLWLELTQGLFPFSLLFCCKRRCG